MTEAGTPAAPAPGGNAPAPSNNNAATQQSGLPAQSPAQPENNPRARGHSPAADARQPQQTPAEPKIKVGDAEYTAADLQSAIAERAEAQSRKATLPAGPDQYEVKLPADFIPPENVRFEFDPKDPALKAFREVAAKHGVSQELFSDALAVFASTKMGAAIQQNQLRDVNMRQLGTAGPQRVEAVATWLQARAGADGKTMANFLRQFPSAPIVRSVENLMRQFSSQGGADFSQSHRAQEEQAGKIPGYDGMSFVQRRSVQMQTRMATERDYGRAPTKPTGR